MVGVVSGWSSGGLLVVVVALDGFGLVGGLVGGWFCCFGMRGDGGGEYVSSKRCMSFRNGNIVRIFGTF